MKFSTMEEVIQRANDTHYGLAAGILTNDMSKALRFSQAINAGTVWYVNPNQSNHELVCYNFCLHG